MIRILQTALALTMAAFLAAGSLPGVARADADMQAAVVEAVGQDLRRGPWVLDDVTLGAPEEESRGIMRAVTQPFTAAVRGRVARFVIVDESPDYMILDMVADPDRTTLLEGVAEVLTGPGMTEVQITYADPDMRNDPGEILQRLRINDRTVLLLGTPEAEAAMARMAARREAEMAEFVATYGGEWAGMRSCRNEEMEVRLNLEPGDEHMHLDGTLSFQTLTYVERRNIFAEAEGFGLPGGSYTVNANYNERNDVIFLRHVEWLDRPGNVGFFDRMRLQAGEEDGIAVLTGTDGVQCRFRLVRPDVFAAEREPLLAPFRAMLEGIELGTWIEGSQIGPVDNSRDGQREWPLRVRVESFSDYHVAATVEMMVFRQNDGAAVREAPAQIIFMLAGGLDSLNVRFGPQPQVGTRLRNVYGSNRCPARLAFEEDTLIIRGSGAENPACLEEMRMPFVPRP